MNFNENNPHPAHLVSYSSDYFVEKNLDDCDVPLDMSIKRRPTSSSSLNNTDVGKLSSQSTSIDRGRPTVITCVSGWDLESALPPPPPYSVTAAHSERNRKTEKSILINIKEAQHSTTNIISTQNRNNNSTAREVFQVGPVDPEIDEHFRRSLGVNYQQLFATESSSHSQLESNDSVDDHFLKALGSTWTKFKDVKRADEILFPLSEAANSSHSNATSRPWEDSPPNSHLYSQTYNHNAPVDFTLDNFSNKIQKGESSIIFNSSNINASTL